MDLAALDLAAMTPEEFASLVKRTPRRELDEAMSGPLRRAVLDEVFARMASRLRPDRAATLDAVVHWHITGAPGGDDAYQQRISGGTCTVGPIAEEVTPRLSITTDAVSFLKLASGNASGPALFMTRKLKLAGDLALGAGLTGYFDIPKA
jgi:putative sterol carrier protein